MTHSLKHTDLSKARSQSIKTFLAGMFGNALEWYDFTLYAYFAIIFAEIFFPARNEYIALLTTFGVFAIGFIARPLGGLLIGKWSDQFGRKKAMLITITLITGATFITAILPTFHQVGIIAPILLMLARIVQGFAVSGEINTATTFLTEHAKKNRRGLAGSLVMCSAFFGILIGAFTASFMFSIFSKETIANGAWRLPYIAGVGLGIIGLLIRLRIKETQYFLKANQTKKQKPLTELLTHGKKGLLQVILLTSVMALANYYLIAYFPTFFSLQHMSLKTAMWINSINMTILILLIPIFGLLSDYLGRRPVFIAGLTGFILFSVPIFWLLSQPSLYVVFFGELCYVIILAPIAGLIPTLSAELFPTEIRNSGSGIAYNISQAIFGGTAPLIAIALIDFTGNTLAPAWYLIACTLLSLLAILSLNETAHKDLRTMESSLT